MIVPADRVFFSPEYFRELVPGKTRLEIDSGLGGSHTVVYDRTEPDGRIVFRYDMGHNPDWREMHGQPKTFANVEQARRELFTHAPSVAYAGLSNTELPRYAIRESATYGSPFTESWARLRRDGLTHMLVSVVSYPEREFRPAFWVLYEPLPSLNLSLLQDEFRRRVSSRPADIRGGETYAFETLSEADWEARCAAGWSHEPERVALCQYQSIPRPAAPAPLPPLPVTPIVPEARRVRRSM